MIPPPLMSAFWALCKPRASGDDPYIGDTDFGDNE